MFTAKLICVLSVCYIPFLLAYQYNNETKFKKGLAIGVTIPKEFQNDPEVQTILTSFKRKNKVLAILLTLVQFAFIPMESFNWFMFSWGMWLIACLVLQSIPFARANISLKQLKAERGWRRVPANIIRIDTAAMPKPMKELSVLMFLVPFAVSLLPILKDAENWIVYLIDAASILLFFFCYKFAFRRKSERVNEDDALTEALTTLRRNNWNRIWLLMTWGFMLLNLGVCFTGSNELLFTVGITVFCILLVAASVYIEFSTRKLQEELTKDVEDITVDEDDHWLWGLVYYNPNDSHLVVNNRVGIGTTVNLAKKTGMVLMVVSAILLLSIPFIMPVMDLALNKSPVVEAVEGQLTVSSGHYKFAIAEDEIELAALLDECPKMNKISGTNMPNLYKGMFKAAELGNVNTCMDPTRPPFIYIKTVSGRQYLFGSRDAQTTRDVFQTLQ